MLTDADWLHADDSTGARLDNQQPATIRVGIIKNGNDLTIALSVAVPIVALTDETACEIAEHLTEAVAERPIYKEQQRRQHSAQLAKSLSHAVLTQRQWQQVRDAVQNDLAALRELLNAAPADWLT